MFLSTSNVFRSKLILTLGGSLGASSSRDGSRRKPGGDESVGGARRVGDDRRRASSDESSEGRGGRRQNGSGLGVDAAEARRTTERTRVAIPTPDEETVTVGEMKGGGNGTRDAAAVEGKVGTEVGNLAIQITPPASSSRIWIRCRKPCNGRSQGRARLHKY